MAKKSPDKEFAEAERVAWYKWEFLRRNGEYRKDYQAFVREFGAWFRQHGYWYDQSVVWSREEWKFFTTAIVPSIQAICERWQVSDPFLPAWEFNKSGTYEYKPSYEVLLPTRSSSDEIRDLWERLRHSGQETIADIARQARAAREALPTMEERLRYLELRLDLSRPLQALLAEAKLKIANHKTRYDRTRPPAKPTPQVRRRLDRYDTYLRVWDLRTRGEKFEVIGALVFRGKPRSAQRALDNFRRAQELIGGRYKELRYPNLCPLFLLSFSCVPIVFCLVYVRMRNTLELRPEDLPVSIRLNLPEETKEYILVKTKQDRLLLNKPPESPNRPHC
jgi:hypothetical protein